MDSDDLPVIDPNVDYREILPIQQKRTIAFINHFVTNTVSFLNHFAQSCESRLMEFEYKIQKVEASLLILESQLSSIPEIEASQPAENVTVNKETPLELPAIVPQEGSNVVQEPRQEHDGLAACKDPRFSKFFKMVQVGVPTQAVKNKMTVEGIDPNILDKPNEVIPGFSNETGDSNVSTLV